MTGACCVHGDQGGNKKRPPRYAGWPSSDESSMGRCPVPLFEGSDGAGLVVLDVKDSIELGQLQQIVNLLGQIQ